MSGSGLQLEDQQGIEQGGTNNQFLRAVFPAKPHSSRRVLVWPKTSESSEKGRLSFAPLVIARAQLERHGQFDILSPSPWSFASD